MDLCVTSRMATCNSAFLRHNSSAAGWGRYIDPQSFGDDPAIYMVARKRARHTSSVVTAAFRPEKKLLNECTLLNGTVLSRRNRRCVLNDKTHVTGVIVSEDDVHDHRKVLERFFHGKPETVLEEEEVENERHSRSPLSPLSMVRWDQDSVVDHEKTVISWWRKLESPCQMTPHARGIILLNLLTFLYGSNVSVIKNAGLEMDPTLFSLGRFAIASLAFAPFLRAAISSKKLVNVGAELGLWASMGYLTQCIAVLTSEASRVSFISTFTVIVVPLLAGLSGAKITKITWGAAFAALLGVAFLESGGTSFDIGDVWSFVSAIMFGVHMLRTEQHSVDLLAEDSLPIISLQMVVITLCSGLWSLGSHFGSGDLRNIHVVNWPQLAQQAAGFPWLAMLYTGLLTTAFCLWCELVSLRDVKATEAAVIYTLEPLWGAAFAWILMGERWGPNGWVGATFILGGCLTMQLFGHTENSGREQTIPDFPPGRTKVEDGKKLEIDSEPTELTMSKRRRV